MVGHRATVIGTAISKCIDELLRIDYFQTREDANAFLRIDILPMLPAPSYDHMEEILNEESFTLKNGIAEGLPLTTQTVGFILFDQNFQRDPIQDLIANLEMLNSYSGSNLHFFLCGVSKFGKTESGARDLGTINGVQCYHNAEAAVSFAKVFRREIPSWRYNMGLDLIFIDVNERAHRRCLNFSSAVFLNIDEVIKRGIVERPSELIGKLITYVQDGRAANSVDFRKELTGAYRRNWIRAFFLKMFPDHVGELARTEAVLFGGSATLD